MNFKPGDIVQLKSGGPKMTVAKVAEFATKRGRTAALCRWFDSDGKVQQTVFELEELKVVADDAS